MRQKRFSIANLGKVIFRMYEINENWFYINEKTNMVQSCMALHKLAFQKSGFISQLPSLLIVNLALLSLWLEFSVLSTYEKLDILINVIAII